MSRKEKREWKDVRKKWAVMQRAATAYQMQLTGLVYFVRDTAAGESNFIWCQPQLLIQGPSAQKFKINRKSEKSNLKFKFDFSLLHFLKKVKGRVIL